MKKVVAIFLVHVILLQCSMKLLIYACFEVNRDYIVKTQCENRDKPKMHCDGKCYLSKKIKKQNEQENKIPAALKGIEKSMISYCEDLYVPDFVVFSSDKQSFPCHVTSFATAYLKSIFKPPRTFSLQLA
jgi:hypothetical protein